MFNKKAFLSYATIINIALLTLSLVLILGLWNIIFSEAESAVSESLCESFNAARFQASWKPAGQRITFVPRTCKIIDKTEKEALPEKGYPETLEGTQENIQKLIVKCWNMWLKGYEDDMFDANVFPGGKQDCFVCYALNIKKGIKPSFNSSDFDKSLSKEIYIVEDASDRCHGKENFYSGGYCRTACKADEKSTPSKKCKTNEYCCIQSNKDNECIDKGGACRQLCNENEKPFPPPEGWKCAGKYETCCIENKNLYTYRDYVQVYGGVGRIDVKPGIEFCPQGSDCADTYAIAFAAKTTNWIWSPAPTNINRIVVTTLTEVKDKECHVQTGVSGD
ncbi:hypothetical protein KY332_03165 [Candidatus Woesearchaeota archaeon]|nr:hypothetical protein [Candidatus Woesearchaeota archaeon]